MKELIYTNTGGQSDFQKEVAEACDRCNELINIFESFQDWQKIASLQDFKALITDPAGYMDETVLNNATIKDAGQRRPIPSVLAKIYGIEYDNYLNIVSGVAITDLDCVPCKRAKVRKGSRAITYREYQSYSDFLIFETRFRLNENTITEHLKTFDIVASTPAQLAIVSHYRNLTTSLNDAIRYHKLGPVQIQSLAKMFGLQIVNTDLVINPIELAKLVTYAK